LEDTPVQHVLRKTLEHYVPEDGRKVNLWSLAVGPEEFFEDVQRASLKVVKRFLELGLEQKRDRLVGADRHAREQGRADYRNGFYLRKSFRTAIGRIEGLRIPRCRKCSLIQALEDQLERTKGAFEEKGVEMFPKGLSVRAIGPLLDGLLGLPVSPGQVSRLARRWDHLVAKFHNGPLEDRYRYLFFDGIHLKRRNSTRLFKSPGQARHRVALVCYGIARQGRKELIGYRLEGSESEAGWRRFLGSLRRRGLSGARPSNSSSHRRRKGTDQRPRRLLPGLLAPALLVSQNVQRPDETAQDPPARVPERLAQSVHRREPRLG
jgi:transposase-like protein